MMKNLRALSGALCLAWLAVSSPPARAAQGSGCLPTTGTYNGVAYASLMNSAFAALISTSSGAIPPKTDCSGATVIGQQWYDTSIATPAWRIFDGTVPLLIGFIDPTNHIWQPQMGGGIANLASAATTDLCSTPATYVAVSGSTTISSFGSSCAVGQIKVANFSSVLAIAYGSSSIILPTGASITTQAGDQEILLYTGGGVWRAATYLRADGSALSVVAVPAIHYAGQTVSMRGTTCPAGSLIEDGSAISRTTYPTLFAYIGSTWGAGDGSTTFNLPDSRGYADRGWGPSQTVDSGRVFGSTQQDQLQDHTHGAPTTAGGSATTVNTSGSNQAPFFSSGNSVTTTIPNSGNHGSETRMKNITALHCIFTSNLP